MTRKPTATETVQIRDERGPFSPARGGATVRHLLARLTTLNERPRQTSKGRENERQASAALSRGDLETARIAVETAEDEAAKAEM